MHTIIKVPSVYSVKLPGSEWLNLALIRRLQYQEDPPTAHITWENGLCSGLSPRESDRDRPGLGPNPSN